MRLARVWGVALVVAWFGTGCPTTAGPRLIPEGAVPGDVRDLAAGAWTDFLAAFPARDGCLPDLRLETTRSLGDRARYTPEPSLLLVRIPATEAQLRTALVHEFAHHLEFTCPDHRSLRRGFLLAQGLPPSAPWFEGATWEETPSELFAEATVEVVLGFRTLHRNVRITQEATRLVAAWGRGS